MTSFSIKFVFLVTIFTPGLSSQLKSAKDQHRLQISSNTDFRYLASITDTNYVDKVLDHILIPRVVGTDGHETVFQYLIKELRRHSFHIDVDEFVQRVPIFGDVTFKNIVAKSDPQAQRFLVLACHYDSKYFKNQVFVGAIDSAVPCGMMLEIAKSLNKELMAKKGHQVGLELIFFDGEEAFKEWGPNDSIWGAKHLAYKFYMNRTRVGEEVVNDLDKIDVLMLLDLIGASNPKFLSYFENTEKWFLRLAQIEVDLHHAGLLKNHRVAYFQAQKPYGRIEDDHLPFLKRNVPILHLITTPFPPEWHTPKDNRDIIDMDTVYNLNLILKTFISEYLHLLV